MPNGVAEMLNGDQSCWMGEKRLVAAERGLSLGTRAGAGRCWKLCDPAASRLI